MWLKRVQGGRTEVLEGVGATVIGEPFEVDAKTGAALLKDARFEKPSAAQVKAAEKASHREVAPAASGDGSNAAPAGDDASPKAAPDHSDPAFGTEED